MSSGSISAMLTSLKNNKIPKREHKLGHLEYTKGIPIGKKLVFKNKMTLKELDQLKSKLQKQKRRSTLISIGLYAVILSTLLVFTLLYVL